MLLCVLAILVITPRMTYAYCAGWDKSLPNYDPDYYSVSHEYKRSMYVVEAEAIRETWLGEDGKPKALVPPFQSGSPRPWGFDPYMGTYYDVAVLRVFKGKPPAHLRLFSENSTARFWLDIGKKYVLFVDTNTFDAPIDSQLSIDTCGNSGVLPPAQKILQNVEKLSAH